jgi:hypothetical protein
MLRAAELCGGAGVEANSQARHDAALRQSLKTPSFSVGSFRHTHCSLTVRKLRRPAEIPCPTPMLSLGHLASVMLGEYNDARLE